MPSERGECDSPVGSARVDLRPHKCLDSTAGERRKWIDGMKSQVGPAAWPIFAIALAQRLALQIFSWHFDVFALDKSSSGNPLITMTVALLESYGLLVSSPLIWGLLRHFAARCRIAPDLSPTSCRRAGE